VTRAENTFLPASDLSGADLSGGLAACASPRDDHGKASQSCPAGYTAQAVPVNRYTLWACTTRGGSTPAATVTVRVTMPGPTTTVTAAQNCTAASTGGETTTTDNGTLSTIRTSTTSTTGSSSSH